MGLIEAFEEHLQKQDRSAHTVNGYVHDLQVLFAWLQGHTGKDIPPEAVTFFDVKRYWDELEDARKKPATTNRTLSALRQFFDWMAVQGHMACNPAASVKQIRVEWRTPRSLSEQEVYLLQRTAAARRQLAEAQANGDGETELLTSPAVRVARRVKRSSPCLVYGYQGRGIGRLASFRCRDWGAKRSGQDHRERPLVQ